MASDTSLTAFIDTCAAATAVNEESLRRLTAETVAYYHGAALARERLRERQRLEAIWYESVGRGTPDYSVYTGEASLAEAWACYVVYSRGYIRSLSRLGLPAMRGVVDVGCGVGYTTAALKALWPDAAVVGTNVQGPQFDVAAHIGRQRGFSVVSGIGELPTADLLFASEYFEHFEDPVSHLDSLLVAVKPSWLVIANAFGSQSVGHFPAYKYAGEVVTKTKIGRVFNAAVRAHGFQRRETGFWNNRPAVWMRA